VTWKRILKLLFFTGCLWFCIHCSWIIIDGLHDNADQADLAVILGNKVETNGSPSPRLKARLDKGLQLYRAGRAKRLLVSGGLGKEGFWEAEVMKDYLIQKAVPDSLIIIDNQGNDTELTVENSLALQDSLHFHSLIVVSQYFHVTRTKKLYKEKGFTRISSAAPNYFELRDLYSIPREFLAFYFD